MGEPRRRGFPAKLERFNLKGSSQREPVVGFRGIDKTLRILTDAATKLKRI